MALRLLHTAAIATAFFFLFGCGHSPRTAVIVSAAASLQSSMDRIEAEYEAANPGIDIIINYGPSGALQKQIEQGAPADLFLSAGVRQMDALRDKDLLETSIDLLGNRLVVIGADSLVSPITDLSALTKPDIRTIAIGDPETVPAGAYTAEALLQAELWEQLEPKLVYAKDVRQVATYVGSGNTDAGFVYRTDALHAGIDVQTEVPAELHAPIRYPAALLRGAGDPVEAERLYRYLTTDEAAAVIFEEDGFQVIRP